MTEEELETAFSQLSLAYRCDQYTLCQRLEAEEHARDKAEDNLKLEVERGMEMLETLKGMCLDIKRASLLQRLELCLRIIGGTIGRISSTAEVLGAVHQEAKVSRAVELMVAHVENLKCRHERNSAELEEIKKQVEKCRRKGQACELIEEIEATEKMEKESQKPHLRCRISIKVTSKQDQRQKVKEPQATTFSVSNDTNEVRESSTNKPDQTEDCLQMDRRQVFPEESSLKTADNKAPKETSCLASAQTHSKQIRRYETDPHCVNK
ncbi:inositol 1,4,5-triphosphate receptor associated 2 [Xyrauchen texanus]|uniref:inositol 1,4,5-triphosphate receptor associated 2 n=1 Tax=Xyrauchen texanus TaxID=154827 RepID=UPI002242BFC5|nr:inositol 1,4,5-triphosphate receptor associated 2 [Xyrauchen texanus]